MAASTESYSEKIDRFFPISPHCDHKYAVKNNPPSPESGESRLAPRALLTPETTPTKKGAKVKADVLLDKPTEAKSELQPSKPSRKGRSKSKVKAKKAPAKPRSQSLDSPLAKKKTKAKPPSVPDNNKVLTDFFPVRRSYRTTSVQLKKQQKSNIEEAILNQKCEGIKVVEIEGKGRGVVSMRAFHRGEFVVEYAGELIDLATAKGRESKYSGDSDIGCYMYYFEFRNKNYCIDATAETGKLGRLLNHSRTGNCKTQIVGIGTRPYLILVAAQDIEKGEEMLYDYGDRSKETLEAHPWLLC